MDKQSQINSKSDDKTLEQKLTVVYNIITPILLKKSESYSGSKDIYKTFETSSEILGTPVLKVILSRMIDKIVRINTQFDTIYEKDYPAEDSIIDLLGYSILLAMYYLDKRNERAKN